MVKDNNHQSKDDEAELRKSEREKNDQNIWSWFFNILIINLESNPRQYHVLKLSIEKI